MEVLFRGICPHPNIIIMTIPQSEVTCHHGREAASAYLKTLLLDPNTLESLNLGIGEALSNAQKYGKGTTFLGIRTEGNQVIVTLEYPSDRFNTQTEMPDPLSYDVPESGRGIPLMRAYLDSVEYLFNDKEKRVLVTLRKFI